MAEIGENQENKGNERKLRETGRVTKGFALAGLASMVVHTFTGIRAHFVVHLKVPILLRVPALLVVH